MLSQLGHVSVGLADSIMVGQLGASQLAAVSLANSLFIVFMTFGLGLSYAITPMVAIFDGEQNKAESMEVLKHGLVINVGFGIIISGLLLLSSGLIYHLDQPEAVVILARPYFNLIAFSLIPLMLFQTFRQFAEGLSFTRQAMVISVVTNLLNILLNYLLIFGKFGFPELGLNGAGWATLISRIIQFLLIGWYVYNSRNFKEYWRHFHTRTWSTGLIRKISATGVPIGFQFVFEVSAFSLAAIMMGWLGEFQLAAHQIAISLAALTYMMASGLGTAVTIRVGNQLGLKDIVTLREVGFSTIMMGIIFMTFNALIFILGRSFFPALYIDNKEVIEIAASLMVVAAFFQISDGIQVIALNALRGLSDVKTPTLITMISYWIIGLPTGYLLAFTFGIGFLGIWIGLLLGLTSAALLLTQRFNRLTKTMLIA